MQEKTFRWSDIASWEPTIRKLMGNYLDDAVVAAFKNAPPEFVVSDDLTWLDRIVGQVHGVQNVDTLGLLTQRLREHYAGVVAFHGCRPTSLEEYQTHGVLASNPEQLEKLAFGIFGDTERVRREIASLRMPDLHLSYEEHNAGKVFFTLTKDELIKTCGGYLLYGSEYLLCIANGIGESHKLRARGKATIIECLVPMNRIGSEYVKCLAGAILEEMFERVLDHEYRREDLVFGFPIEGGLPPKSILKFHFPKRIPNPSNKMAPED